VPPGILIRAQILVDTKNKIALLWTPKSGATFTVRWFFAHNGLLDEALRYNKFVHRYRDDIYRFSEEHYRSVAAFLEDPEAFNVVKITRHPLKRAVSSYIHTNKHGFSDKKISRFLRRHVSEKRKYSFREFVSYLENVNIYECNIHYRAQLHMFEKSGKIKINHIIDLDQSIGELGHLEKELGLPSTDLVRFSKSRHHTKRVNIDTFCGDDIVWFKQKGVQIPDTKSFYDEELVQRVGSIYKDDFTQYGYNCSLEEI
jgi:hypothetical protein